MTASNRNSFEDQPDLMMDQVFLTYCTARFHAVTEPRAGSGVVRIDPLRFLAGCTRRLNQAYSVYHMLYYCIVVY